MERPEGDMSLKNPVTPPGIDPGTVRLVAQRLNHYATPVPKYRIYSQVITTLLWFHQNCCYINPPVPFASSVLDPNIFLRSPLSDILSLYRYLSVRDVSQPC